MSVVQNTDERIMDIVYVSPSSFPSRTANSVHVAHQVYSLKLSGVNICLICKKQKYNANIPKILNRDYNINIEKKEVASIYFPWKRGTTLVIALFAILKLFFCKKKFSVISRNLYFNFIWSVVMRRCALYETHQLETGVGSVMQRAVLKSKLSQVVVISNQLKTLLAKHYKVSSSNFLFCVMLPHKIYFLKVIVMMNACF